MTLADSGAVTITFAGSGDAFGSGGRFRACIHLRQLAGPPVLVDCGAFDGRHAGLYLAAISMRSPGMMRLCGAESTMRIVAGHGGGPKCLRSATGVVSTTGIVGLTPGWRIRVAHRCRQNAGSR